MDVQDVRGDGNCFYRALFQAARSGGCIGRVWRAFRVSSRRVPRPVCYEQDEDRFVALARERLSEMLAHSPQYLECAFVVMCQSIHQADRGAVRDIGISYGMPDWVTTYFVNNKAPYHFERFVKACRLNVLVDGSFAGNVDVLMCQAILNRMHLSVFVRRDNDFPTTPAVNTMYLRLVNDNHYNWMKYPQAH